MVRSLFFISLCACSHAYTSAEPPVVITPEDAGPADAADADAPSVRWRGGGAANVSVTYGGGTFCRYETTLTKSVFDLTLNGTQTQATGNAALTLVESIVGSCQYAPLGQRLDAYVLIGAATEPRPAGGFHVELRADPANQPVTSLVVDATPNAANSMSISIVVTRIDAANPALGWTMTATSTLSSL